MASTAAARAHAKAIVTVTAAVAALLLNRQRGGHVQLKTALCQLFHICHQLVCNLLGYIKGCSLQAAMAGVEGVLLQRPNMLKNSAAFQRLQVHREQLKFACTMLNSVCISTRWIYRMLH